MEPGFEELLGDESAMVLWEVLRRVGRAANAARLAEWTDRAAAQVQQQLDRLERHGCVRAVRSRSGAAYEAVQVAEMESSVAARFAAHAARLGALRSDGHLRRTLSTPTSDGSPDATGGFGMSVRLGAAELAEVRRRLDDLRRFLLMTQQGNRTGRGRRGEAFHACTHHVVARVLVAPDGELPLPDGVRGGHEGGSEGRTRTLADLSPREREVAMALLAGQTMRQVADALGLSFYTIDTLVRRVYRKLGVRRRTEFVMRMRDAERG